MRWVALEEVGLDVGRTRAFLRVNGAPSSIEVPQTLYKESKHRTQLISHSAASDVKYRTPPGSNYL